jgi:nitrite reductase/ring-hydroxylating ferredoxin subunit
VSEPIRIARRDALARGEVRVVSLADDERMRPPEALVLLDGAGELRCYLNECQHLPVPLDAGSRRFLDPSGAHLLCRTHGALYRLNDGLCVGGPCPGRSLRALPVRVDEEGWVVLDRMDDDEDDEFDFVEIEDEDG